MSSFRTSQIKHPDKLFINGIWTAPSTAGRIDVYDSASEEVFLSVADAQAADVELAVTAARQAFDTGPWPRMSHAERATYLEKIAAGLTARAGMLADHWSAEAGVLRSMSEYSGPGLAQVFSYYAGLANSFAWQETHQAGDGKPALLVREPVGVVAAIVPWNAPGLIMAYKVAPALISGCTVIVKASPEAPSAPYILAEICEEAGLPAGVLNVLTAQREVSELLVRDNRVDKITFTGSTAAGQRIGSICGERIARCTLELGGKSPAIILDDYDLELAAESLAASTALMTGQVCAALSRIVVPKRRHDAFVEALACALGRFKVGDPFATDTQMGPLSSSVHRDRVERYIAVGNASKARLALGGGRPRDLNRGYYIEPTVFSDVDNRDVIAREEIFGPVVCVIPADDENQAIDIANDSEFGLNSSVFTHDPERAYAVARRLRTGTVGINAFKFDFGISFGGFKRSGIGREGGRDGVLPFLEAKTILFEEMPTTAVAL
ncbi:aldehyde dehydrogenase [Sphingobium sp. JS3065]|uniref:aldehyde dehydrogenase n=1 Tax=Sphingobium sp. JS3065 TaxID=2970925 RepID=UPI002264E2CB|nr:aldehyde dehydrogenase [Sphingobium sp. JS3065]UZW56429.1 aldehyde dehydrogenase [Sphingobium sp. JS3065]